MTVTLTAPTELDKARALVDAGHLARRTGAELKPALWHFNESSLPEDVDRALQIRALWNADHDRWAEQDRQILRIHNWH